MIKLASNPLNFDDWQAFCTDILVDSQGNSTLTLNTDENTAFINYLKSNGIACLLIDALENQQKTALLPDMMVNQLQGLRRVSSVNELYNKQNLMQTIALFDSNTIDCLILKGSALAYSLYRQPYHRIRGDTDLLIRHADKDIVDALLVENGYQRAVNVSGRLISHQNTYGKIEKNSSHNYDIHWKLSNRNAYADLFDFDELYKRRKSVAGLGENASRLSDIDALLHAIIHYYGHFPGERERLIWVYDIHLLCSELKADQWQAFLEHSKQKNLDPLSLEALLLTQRTFKTKLPDNVLQTLKQSPVRLSKIEQRRLKAGHWTRIEQFKSDWAVLTLTQRCRLIKEYLLPPGEFVLQQNHSTNKLLLPYFYCKRILLGALKVIKNPRAQ